MFINAWIHKIKHKQKVVFSIKRFEGLLLEFFEIMKKTGYKKTINKPKINPNSSTNIAKMKSLWDSGIEYFSWPSPSPTPNKPPSLIESVEWVKYNHLNDEESLDSNIGILIKDNEDQNIYIEKIKEDNEIKKQWCN